MIGQKEKACPFDWDLLAHFMPFKGHQNTSGCGASNFIVNI